MNIHQIKCCVFLEFTDAIAEDWGGKPFVDMINGWNHVLTQYPEVTDFLFVGDRFFLTAFVYIDRR